MLKIWIDDIKDIEIVSESLKQDIEFILDDKKLSSINNEFPINLYHVKIGDYYIFDAEYINELIDEATGYRTVLTEIGITRDSSKAIYVEDWEIEHIKQGVKGEIKILKMEEKENK